MVEAEGGDDVLERYLAGLAEVRSARPDLRVVRSVEGDPDGPGQPCARRSRSSRDRRVGIALRPGRAPAQAGGAGGLDGLVEGVAPQRCGRGRAGRVAGTTGSPSRITITQASSSCSGWAWIWLWWRWQSSARLSIVVGPPRDHQITWCASHSEGGVVQPGQTQPRSRAARAVCCAAVASRPMVSIASTRPGLSRTTRSMTASHAIRVSAPRPTRSPSVVTAAPAPSAPASCSGVVTTTTRGTARAAVPRPSCSAAGAGHLAPVRRLGADPGSARPPRPAVRVVLRRRGPSRRSGPARSRRQPAGLVELAAEQDHPGLVGRDRQVPPVQGVLVVPVRPVRGDHRQQVPGQVSAVPGSNRRACSVSRWSTSSRRSRTTRPGSRFNGRPRDVDVLTRHRTGRQRRTQLAQGAGVGAGQLRVLHVRRRPPAVRPGTGTSAGSPSAHPAHHGRPGPPGTPTPAAAPPRARLGAAQRPR